MTFLGVIGVLLALGAVPLASFRSRTAGSLTFLSLFAVHLASSIAFYFYALGNPVDSYLYYYDPIRMSRFDFQFGTVFLVQLVAAMKSSFGGTYLDYFLLFQAFGFWGVLLLWKVIDDVHLRLNAPRSQLSYWMFFLPGLHFWTGFLGKDGPLFLGLTLAVWSALHIMRRLPFFVLAIALIVLFRPHIALAATTAMALALVFDRNTGIPVKALLLVTAIAGAAYIAGTVESTFGVDVTSRQSISEFLTHQQNVSAQAQGNTAVRDAGFLTKLLSLLFRPFFFDANGIFALIASFESIFFLFVFGFLVLRWKDTAILIRRVFFLRFALLLTVSITILLTIVYYNVGLGARQKMMLVPSLFALFAAQWALWRRRIGGSPRLMAPVAGPAQAHGIQAQ